MKLTDIQSCEVLLAGQIFPLIRALPAPNQIPEFRDQQTQWMITITLLVSCIRSSENAIFIIPLPIRLEQHLPNPLESTLESPPHAAPALPQQQRPFLPYFSRGVQPHPPSPSWSLVQIAGNTHWVTFTSRRDKCLLAPPPHCWRRARQQ